MNVPATVDIMESVLLKGDLSRLTSEEKLRYYNETCKSLGLNPLTQPFLYVKLSGREVLYATRNGADQLRKINNVSLEIISRTVANNILTVHCRARLPDGRTDEDYGSVYYPDSLQGEARANAELKAVTKAKRRTTLSICGLGWLDENEVDDIPVMAHRRPPPPAPNPILPDLAERGAAILAAHRAEKNDRVIPHNPDTGEVLSPAPDSAAAEQAAPPDGPPPDGAALPPSDDILNLEDMAREAAIRGEAVFKAFWKSRSPKEREQLKDMGEELRTLMQ